MASSLELGDFKIDLTRKFPRIRELEGNKFVFIGLEMLWIRSGRSSPVGTQVFHIYSSHGFPIAIRTTHQSSYHLYQNFIQPRPRSLRRTTMAPAPSPTDNDGATQRSAAESGSAGTDPPPESGPLDSDLGLGGFGHSRS
jgi:hypothetical protein